MTSKIASPTNKEPIKLVAKFSKLQNSGEKGAISTENQTPGEVARKSLTVEVPQGQKAERIMAIYKNRRNMLID